MKNKLYNIILLIFISIGFVACEDYVDYEASEGYTIVADDYFTKAADYEAALVGTYDVLQWNIYSVMIGDIASDNSYCGGESATDVVGLQKIDDMIHNPVNDQLESTWKWMYEGINRANYLVENKDKVEFSRKAELYGEVHFLRAYYYFELAKIFGDVPLFTQSRLTAGDSSTLQRTPVSEVYAQIESDLKAAIAVLPAAKSLDGRATSFTAHALLGKVYLYQDKFDEAASILEPLVGLYTLVPDLQDVFLTSGENGSESVFEVQHSKNSNWWDWGFPQGSEGSFGVIHHGIRGYNGSVYAQGWSFNVPTKDLYDAYSDGDSRRSVALLDIVAWAKADGAEYAEGYEHTGYFNHKYIPRAGATSAQGELNYETNYRAIRYADVLLMAAEANNRKTSADDVKAQNYLNQVRARAFGNDSKASSSTGAVLTQEIWDERRLELAMEGQRFFDLVRTGEAATKIEGFVSGKHEVFPIPQTEIDISGLTQNSGY
ncbi:RagB/SusD family nutrient uptake outer membrane protein [Flavobacteriaceae bacterium]|nr:RagB/SusD family nutrient uptake outer membrane protein [Flavobacteriaceae bacterium]